MSTERGTAQPPFTLAKWGFKKTGPVGWSVLAGLAVEPAQSGLGEVNVQQARARGQLAGNFCSAS